MNLKLKKLLGAMVCGGIILSVNACDSWWLSEATRGELRPQRLLKVAVIQQPFTYQKINQMEMGYEFELLQSFAQEFDYEIEIQVLKNQNEVISTVEKGDADIGAARLPDFVIERSKALRGPSYDEDRLALVCHRKQKVSFNFLGSLSKNNSFRLITSAKYVDPRWSSKLQQSNPEIKVRSLESASAMQLLREVQKRKQDCTILDRLEAKYYQRFFSQVKVLKEIPLSRAYTFVVDKANPSLERELRVWTTKAARRQQLSQAKKIAKLKTEELHHQDVQKFMNAKNHVLPLYRSWFRKHSKEFDIPWQLAAAVAYQESHWNPDAKSFTGVQGFMQLTRETARHLGVEDRMDPEQSIWGGVKYLKMLLDRQPKDIPSRDRLSIALATYNVGPAHMQDAQKLAIHLGKNPYSWKDLQSVLPLLAEQSYLEYLKYGKARGQEPVDFVHRVFAYLDLMSAKI